MADKSRQALWQAVGFAWTLGYTIAVPLVVLALAGRFLDRRYGTEPWLLLTGILLSIIISSVALVRRATTLIEKSANEPTPPKP